MKIGLFFLSVSRIFLDLIRIFPCPVHAWNLGVSLAAAMKTKHGRLAGDVLGDEGGATGHVVLARALALILCCASRWSSNRRGFTACFPPLGAGKENFFPLLEIGLLVVM